METWEGSPFFQCKQAISYCSENLSGLNHYMACTQDMAIWDMVGLWHYPLPGLFLLAQFCLGILIALGNLVNNSVFLYLSNEGNGSSNDNSTVQGNETHYFNIN